MFILINIYFVGHVYTLFGVVEKALFTPSSQGGISIQRGTSIRGGGYIYLFLIHCPGGTSIKEGMFIWHYRVCDKNVRFLVFVNTHVFTRPYFK